MSPKRSLRWAAVSTGAVALCCFTPILVPLMGALGAAALLPWLDWLLLPVLALCVLWLLIAIRRNMEQQARLKREAAAKE